MKQLLQDKELAIKLGKVSKKAALDKFNIKRFTTDWGRLFYRVVTAVKPLMISEGVV